MKTLETNVNISENLDLTNLAAEDLKHLEKALGVGSTVNYIVHLSNEKVSRSTWKVMILNLKTEI